MVFVVRSGVIALVTFAFALLGFGLESLLPAGYVADSKGMIGSVVGLDATLLALVLGLLIWTAHGQFMGQQAQLQTIGRSLILLDLAFAAYGPDAAPGRLEIREMLKRARKRFWIDDPNGRRAFAYDEIRAEVMPMRAVFERLRPSNEDERHHLQAARDHFGTIIDTELTMIRSLVNPVPNLLLAVVVGWACVEFFGYGVMASANALTVVMAALGALSVGSAAFLILELSDPYVGVFRLPIAGFDGLTQTLTVDEARAIADADEAAG